MAVHTRLAPNSFAGTEFARLRELLDRTKWSIDGRADVVYVVGSAVMS